MWYGIQDLGKSLMGIRPTDSGEQLSGQSHGDLSWQQDALKVVDTSTGLRKDEFWAVKDVSFDLKRGEILGLIGVNGCGKSTLLRLLAGIFPPDQGEIMIRGRMGALIALGAGFHPHMTGRENIYLNGTILGLTKKEINSRFDEIVDFSEIGDFIDAPVATYSSGMHVRLGFSIATAIRPDVLLIDEVLAVGDMGFKYKCFNRIAKIIDNAAVIFVSHDMGHLAGFCSHALMMRHGAVTYHGNDVPQGIQLYQSEFKNSSSFVAGNGKARIHAIRVYAEGKEDAAVQEVPVLMYGDNLNIELKFDIDPGIAEVSLTVNFLDERNVAIAQCMTQHSGIMIKNSKGMIRTILRYPRLPFNPALYRVWAIISNDTTHEVLVTHYAAKTFRVEGPFVGFASIQPLVTWRSEPETSCEGLATQ
jgi:lipopolysaccharide transport system ATP-binding protein